MFQIICAGGMVISFLLMCLFLQPANKQQEINRRLVKGCRLQRVELVSFSAEADVMVVMKCFGDDYLERSRYHLPYLPTIPVADSRARKMVSVVTANGKTVAFDQAGNAYLAIGKE